VLVVGEDGAAFTLNQSGQILTVPVGRYAVEVISLAVRSRDARGPWRFVFTRNFGGQPERWHSVEADRTTTIRPFADLRFKLLLEQDTARPGQELTVSPRLLTADGLTLNASWFGDADRLSRESRYNSATVRLVTATGQVLTTVESGFS